MRAVVQRVKRASVEVNQLVVGQIDAGLLVYLGVGAEDTDADVETMVKKIASLRIFADEQGKMSRSVIDIAGSVLVVSQFTLFGDVRKGNRPEFTSAAPPELAESLYEQVLAGLRQSVSRVESGKFRASMLVGSDVDGPVTIQIDTKKLY